MKIIVLILVLILLVLLVMNLFVPFQGSKRNQEVLTQTFLDCSKQRSNLDRQSSPFWSNSEFEWMENEYRAQRGMEILLFHQKPRGLVVDMGAGSQKLRRFVPKSMSYKAVDLIQRVKDSPTSICNLNHLQFPFFLGEHVSAYFFLRSFEFILDKVNMLRMCRKREAAVVMQFKLHTQGGGPGFTYVTPLSMEALKEAAKIAGYKLHVYDNDRSSIRKIEENNFFYFQPI